MKIFVDENIPRMTVKLLIEKGHDVRDIRGSTLEGMPDKGKLGTATVKIYKAI